MNILLITDSYPPEIRSASKLIYDLRIYLQSIGHHTDVVTTAPRYNIDENWKFTEKVGLTSPLQIKAIPHHNVNFILRGISQLIMPLQFYIGIKTKLKLKYDVCIIYSPPITLGLVGPLLKLNSKITSVLNVQDLFPQNAIDLGILKNRLLIKFFEKIEKTCYKYNDVVTFHSNNNLTSSLKKVSRVKTDNFIVLHNWITFAETLLPDKTYVRSRFKIPDGKKIAIFAGVMGPAQGLENLINLAKNALKFGSNWHFLILGGGSEKNKIVSMVEKRGLTNVQIEGFVNPKEYIRILGGCDLGLVFLSALNKTPVVPGKLLEYMALSKPAFCVVNAESDIHDIIEDSNGGVSVSASLNEVEIWSKFEKFVSDGEHLNVTGGNAYRYAKIHFAIETVVDKLLNYIKKVSN